MKSLIFVWSALLLLLFLMHCTPDSKVDTTKALETAKLTALDSAKLVKRGDYLVTVMVCDDCHTPKKMTANGPEPDLDRRLMGHPANEVYTADALKNKLIKDENVAVFSPGLTGIAGPWGVSYAANLTPHETGTGNWTEANFFKAIREGKYKGLDGGRSLLPPMPWQQYRHLNDEDLRAIFLYLKTLKPIDNLVPRPVPPAQ